MTTQRKFDVNLLVVAEAILSEKNLTRAGEKIGMGQPAVSAALSRLRQHYDDPLLVRQGRVFELTPKAIELQPLIERALDAIVQTLDILPTFDASTSERTFYISASDYALAEMASPLLKVLGKHAPHVTVRFDGLPIRTAVTPDDLLRRDVIIAGTGRGVPGKRKSLFSDQFVCIADAQNPRIKGGSFTIEDVAELRHVRATFGEGNITHVDEMLSTAGLSPHVGLTVQGFMPVPQAVAGTTMVGHVPEKIADRYCAAFGLVKVRTPYRATLIEAAHWHPSKDSDPAVGWLVEMLYLTSELLEFGSDFTHFSDL